MLAQQLREIGLLSDRVLPHYERVGLMEYFKGPSALELSGPQLIAELDEQADLVVAA